MIVALTGTPGTGKSTLGKLLRKKYNVLSLGRFIVRNKLYSRYDRKRRTYVANMRKITDFIIRYKRDKPDLLIDSHLSHLLPKDLVDKVIVLRCDPSVLEKRLKKKGWGKEKVLENKEAEMIGVISFEAHQKHKKVFEIDSSKNGKRKVLNIIEKILNGKGKKYTKTIDWLK